MYGIPSTNRPAESSVAAADQTKSPAMPVQPAQRARPHQAAVSAKMRRAAASVRSSGEPS